MKLCASLVAAFLGCLFVTLCCTARGAVDRPNIVVILADDLGAGDLSCQGATTFATPHIDRLAREGRRFTHGYAPASVCTPTRYGLLTGRYCWRTSLRRGTLDSSGPLLIEPGRMTLASLLAAHGYRTAMIGKWHLGYGQASRVDWNSPLNPGPLELGFHEHFGVPSNHNDNIRAYVSGHALQGVKPGAVFAIEKGRAIPAALEQPRVDDLVNATLTARAVRFIEAQGKQPFFLFFAPTIPHTHITPAPEFRWKSGAGLYGDYIQELDARVGEILAALERRGLSDRTLVIFSSDNGGALSDFVQSGVKLNLSADPEGRVAEKFQQAKRDARAAGHLTNGALRGGKGSAYEGGLRVPFIVRWPGRVPAGATSDAVVCLTDLLATVAGLLGSTLPREAGEDSFDVGPALWGPAGWSRREALVLHGGNGLFAIRQGHWKLVEARAPNQNGGRVTNVYELFHLGDDPNETRDLAAEQPDVVARLAAMLANARAHPRTRGE